VNFLDRRPNEPALDAALSEARRVPAPELDWDRMQERMWQAIDREPAPAKQPVKLRALSAVPVLAVAAGVALWFGRAEVQPATSVASVAEESSLIDGDSLERDQVLQAGSTGLRVVHNGRAEWTLEPNSQASVIEHGKIVRVRLVAGSMRAEVVPAPEKERFVVEAAGTRVAVHGTVFRVAMEEGRNLVDVEQGIVAVAPLDPSHPQAVLLRAPTHAEFALSGVPLEGKHSLNEKQNFGVARLARKAHAPSPPLATSTIAEAAEAASEELPAAPSASSEEPAPIRQRLTIGEVEEGVAPVVATITRCFRAGAEPSGNLRVTAQSAVTLKVAPDGTIEQLSFDPPLSPTVQSCSEREIAEVRFAPSVEGASVTRMLELTR
jgi:ferric-dicitrate binding protein FerR (iron transport regulator)